MEMVGALSLPVSFPLKQESIPVIIEQTLPSNDEYSNDMSVSYDIISFDESKANIINEASNASRPLKCHNYKTVSYGPLNVRVSLRNAPTLKTGRRSKFIHLEGDAATKREKRREKNRETARKLKEKRMNIEHQLVDEINELESRESDLLQEIRNLESYKDFLQRRYQQKIVSTKETIQKKILPVQYYRPNIPAHRKDKQTKTQPCPPSPQWQKYFTI